MALRSPLSAREKGAWEALTSEHHTGSVGRPDAHSTCDEVCGPHTSTILCGGRTWEGTGRGTGLVRALAGPVSCGVWAGSINLAPSASSETDVIPLPKLPDRTPRGALSEGWGAPLTSNCRWKHSHHLREEWEAVHRSVPGALHIRHPISN